MKGADRKVIFQGVHQLMGSDLGPEVGARREEGQQDGVHRHRPAAGHPQAGPGAVPGLSARRHGRRSALSRSQAVARQGVTTIRGGRKRPRPSRRALRARVAPPLRGEPVKKPAVKKTAKKAAAPAQARPAAKKAAPKRAAPPRPRRAAAKKKAAAGEEAGRGQEGRRQEAVAKKPRRQGPAAAKQAAKAAAKKPPPQAVAKAAPAAKLPPRRSPRAAKTAAAPKPAAAPAAALAKVAVPVPTLAPGAPLATPNGFVPRKPGRGTPKYFVAPVQAPLPPPTSRFADRFAPPRPPTRQMNNARNRHARDKRTRPTRSWPTPGRRKAGRDLTDAEVLAMPDAEYMNEKQLEFFRMQAAGAEGRPAQQRRRDHRAPARGHLDRSRPGRPGDDRGRARPRAAHPRPRAQAAEEDFAVARPASSRGEYGFCDETGEPIGLGRLIARPTATLSLEAQQRRELKQKMFGD